MELLPVVCLCLLSCSGDVISCFSVPVYRVYVEEGSDAVLPCLISTKEDISGKVYGWTKGGQDVLFHDPAGHRPEGAQFRGRVSFIEGQWKNGNTSIKITNTKVADSGFYSCDFPHPDFPPEHRAAFAVSLFVGVSPQLSTTTLNQTEDGLLLQCVVRGASMEPRVQWKDSSGNVLPAEEPQVTKRGDLFDVTLQITVTKTDRYRCVSEQEDIGRRIYTETFAPVNRAVSETGILNGSNTGWIVGFLVVSLLLVIAAVPAGLYLKNRITQNPTTGSTPNTTNGQKYAELRDKMIKKQPELV